MFFKSTPALYIDALNKYYKRIDNHELLLRFGSCINLAEFIEIYTKNAIYGYVPNYNLDIQICICIVINKNIEYNLPHTLDNIIILNEQYKYDKKILMHEIMHIYFRYFYSPVLDIFCRSKSLIKIYRNKFIDEITNPDTYDYYALNYSGILIFVYLTLDATPIYMTNCNNITRRSTHEEIRIYDYNLPYKQNYHPEEILAQFYKID